MCWLYVCLYWFSSVSPGKCWDYIIKRYTKTSHSVCEYQLNELHLLPWLLLLLLDVHPIQPYAITLLYHLSILLKILTALFYSTGCVNFVHLWLIPYFISTLIKFWVHGTYNICVYIYFMWCPTHIRGGVHQKPNRKTTSRSERRNATWSGCWLVGALSWVWRQQTRTLRWTTTTTMSAMQGQRLAHSWAWTHNILSGSHLSHLANGRNMGSYSRCLPGRSTRQVVTVMSLQNSYRNYRMDSTPPDCQQVTGMTSPSLYPETSAKEITGMPSQLADGSTNRWVTPKRT